MNLLYFRKKLMGSALLILFLYLPTLVDAKDQETIRLLDLFGTVLQKTHSLLALVEFPFGVLVDYI